MFILTLLLLTWLLGYCTMAIGCITLYRTGQVGQARLFGTVNRRLEAWDEPITSKQLLINHLIVYMKPAHLSLLS